MIGIKNIGSGLPFYSDRKYKNKEQFPACRGCRWGIASPSTALPPFWLPTEASNPSVSWTAISQCGDSSTVNLPSSALEVVELQDPKTDEITKQIQYNGGPLGLLLDPGYYEIIVTINRVNCYSEDIEVCCGLCGADFPCLEISSCEAEGNCCPLPFPSAGGRPRLYSRNNPGTTWELQFVGIFVDIQITGAGGTNLVWSNELCDIDGSPVGTVILGSPLNNLVRYSVPETIISVVYKGSVTFDYECDGSIKQFTFSYESEMGIPSSTAWAFDHLDIECSQSPSPMVSLVVDSCDVVEGEIVSQFILKTIGGITQPISSGTTANVTLQNGDSCLLTRQIQTRCGTTSRSFLITYDQNAADICASVAINPA